MPLKNVLPVERRKSIKSLNQFYMKIIQHTKLSYGMSWHTGKLFN